jgi:hypothetical protein
LIDAILRISVLPLPQSGIALIGCIARYPASRHFASWQIVIPDFGHACILFSSPQRRQGVCVASLDTLAPGRSDILMDGLRKLEYRGYDSAGIATVLEGQLHCVRAKGKLQNLQDKLDGLENPARLGIGHTRWATHGKPEEYNAHPHAICMGALR